MLYTRDTPKKICFRKGWTKINQKNGNGQKRITILISDNVEFKPKKALKVIEMEGYFLRLSVTVHKWDIVFINI